MRNIKLDKVTINMGCGSDKDKMKRSEKFLQKTFKNKPVITVTRRRTLFGMAKRRPVGVKLTLRGEDAEKFLKDVFTVYDNKINKKQLKNGDNFSIGIKEYLDLPNMNYDPDIGMLGFDVCISLKRAGYRVKKRRISKSFQFSRHDHSLVKRY